MRLRICLLLLTVLLVSAGCGQGDQRSGGGATAPPIGALQLRFDFPPARLPAGVASLQVQAFDEIGNLVASLSSARVDELTLELPVARYLIRTLFFDDQGNLLGFSDRVVTLTLPGPTVLEIEVLLTGAPPDSTIPLFGNSPAQLAFLVHPQDAASGTAQDVQVVALDPQGNIAPFTGTINLTLSEGTGVLSGTTQAQAVDGVADFSVLIVGQGEHRLQAATDGLPSEQSLPFDILNEAPVATSLSFPSPPTTGAVGQDLGTIEVQVLDQFGNLLATGTNSVTLGGLTLNGTTTVNAVNGVATFTGVSPAQAGNFQLTATSDGLTQATSPLAVDALVADTLNFVTVPATARDNQAFSVQVEVLDQFGDRLDTSQAVTLGLNSGPANLRLTGTLTMNAVNGLASFNVALADTAGTATLVATSSGAAAAISGNIVVSLFQGRLYVSESPDLVGNPGAIPRMSSFVMGRAAGPLLDGAAPPATQIGGLLRPVCSFIDVMTNTLWLTDGDANGVLIFPNATTNNGPASDTVVANGFPRGVAYDNANDRLYVGEQSLSQCEIFVNASTAGRSVGSTIQYVGTPPLFLDGREVRSCCYDPAADRLFLVVGPDGLGSPGRVDVFDNASTLTGVIDGNANAADRSISDGLVEPADLFYESHTRRLYVRNQDPTTFESQVSVYNNADTTDNPTRAAFLINLNFQGNNIIGVVVDWERDELYLSDGFSLATGQVMIFSGASQMTGTISPTPVRVLTGIDSPAGLSIDLTRD